MKLFGRGARPNGRKAYEKLPLSERSITFYAEDGGSWPHFAPIVEALVERGERICYLTSSDQDPILDAIVIAHHEIALAELGIPANAIQQFPDRYHRHPRASNIVSSQLPAVSA